MGSIVAIGMFDGVHLGHQELLKQAIALAKERNLKCVALTFSTHPASVIAPGTEPLKILTDRERLNLLLETEGIDMVMPIEFHQGIRSMEAKEFVDDILSNKLHAEHVIVGKNFRFGKGAEGTPSTLSCHIDTTICDLHVVDDIVISSTQIRDAIKTGRITKANLMLGKPVSLPGTVVIGDMRGREMGFPTANLDFHKQMAVPAIGVYAGMVSSNKFERKPAAISVGYNTTFGHTDTLRVESHILGYEGNLYGQEINVEFLEHLRGQERYPGMDELIEQLHKDCAKTEEIVEAYLSKQ